MARRLAVVMSHAEGFSGTPRSFQTSSARQKASCTTSSASARLWTPKILVSVATRRPASRRNRWSLSSSHVHCHDGSNFYCAFNFEDGAPLRQLHGLVQVTRFDNLYSRRSHPWPRQTGRR